MQCPKCGYLMSELDQECLRCKQTGGRPVAAAAPPPPPVTRAPGLMTEKECPHCGKTVRLDAALCPRCGHEYEPGISGEDRYQAMLAEEAREGMPVPAPRQHLSPYVSWSIISACVLVVLLTGWVMFGGAMSGSQEEERNAASPIIFLHHRKPRHGTALHAVTYQVTGSAASAIITYDGTDGTTVSPSAAVSLPWTQSFQMKSGAALSLSAKPGEGTGEVVVEIDADHAMRKQGKMPDEDGYTSISDTL